MGGGGANIVSESLTPEEQVEVLQKYGFKNSEWINEDHVGGVGGFSTVVGIAIFASLGGMLFGLDIGYIAGIKSMSSFEDDVLGGEEITPEQDSNITMIFGVGAAIAAFPPILDFLVGRLGRKGSVIAGGVVFCAGATMQGLATNMAVLMIGRLIAGMSVGLLSANVPVYQSEIAPPTHRGMLVSVYQLAITVGIMVAFVCALCLQNVDKPISGWRLVIFVQLIPGLALAFGGLVMGESPRWLVQKGRQEQAYKVLNKVRSPAEDVKLEMAQICREHQKEKESGSASWGEFFSGDNLKLLMIGFTLQMIQQMCGMNAYMYDGPVIFKKLYNSTNAGFIFTAVSGVVNIVSTFPAIFLVDRLGRCTLLKWSAAGMAICSGILALVGIMCFPEHKCHRHAGEECHDETTNVCGDWAKYTATLSICLFIFNFGYGWGPVVWTYCAEMFPTKYRTKATGLTTDANWIGNIFIALLPPILLGKIGFNTFWVFCGINILGFIMGGVLPETKDKTLEEIQMMYAQWFHGSGKKAEGTAWYHGIDGRFWKRWSYTLSGRNMESSDSNEGSSSEESSGDSS